MKRTSTATAALAAALVLAGAPTASATGPGAHDAAGRGDDLAPVALGVLPGSEGSFATDLDDRDRVVGWAYVDDSTARSQAWRWSEGRLTDLGTLAGPEGYSFASATNDRGQVVGTSSAPDGAGQVGFLWQDGVMTALSTPQDAFSPADIDDRGRVVGTGGGSGSLRAQLWRDGVLTTLPAPAECAQTTAGVLNDRGTIVGACYTSGGEGYALLWQGAGRSVRALEASMQVHDVDDRGWLAGQDLTTGRATVWAPQRGGGWRAVDLGAGESSTALDFGRAGEVAVRGFTDSGREVRALLWRRGVLTALPGGDGYEPAAANARGHVVGSSFQATPLLWR